MKQIITGFAIIIGITILGHQGDGLLIDICGGFLVLIGLDLRYMIDD